VDLFVDLRRGSGESLQRQLAEQVRRAVLDGRVLPGGRLPSTRQLARELHISRTIAEDAYGELFSDGYVDRRHGSGTFVARDLPTRTPAPASPPARQSHRWPTLPPPIDLEPEATPGMIDFRLGRPSMAPLPAGVWRAMWRAMSAEIPPNDYGPVAGDPELRAVIADYLRRARGLDCAPDDLVITVGAMQAFDLIVRAALSQDDRVAMEDPGYPEARDVLRSRGIPITPIPVDHDGLRVDMLPDGASAPILAYVTPSHQYPLGGRLTIARRIALIEWARRNDSLVVEDDYDSEFRFDAPPLPALAGMENSGHILYIGTFSKVLTPALRVGYLVAKGGLRERVLHLKAVTDRHTPWPVQRALYAFIRDGQLDRHIRRMRRHYATTREALRVALAPISSLASLEGIDAGLHAYLAFHAPIDPAVVVQAAAARGVIVRDLSGYYLGQQERSGLLLGYGGLERTSVIRGARILAQAIEAAGAADRSA
jgi:GntR family transcriptional regulator/MocR family aminotransferase